MFRKSSCRYPKIIQTKKQTNKQTSKLSGSWVGLVKLGVRPELFSWSISCTRDFASSKCRDSCVKLMKTMMKVNVCCHLGESGCLPLHFFKLVSLFWLAGSPSWDNSASNVRGLQKPARQSLSTSWIGRLPMDQALGPCLVVILSK